MSATLPLGNKAMTTRKTNTYSSDDRDRSNNRDRTPGKAVYEPTARERTARSRFLARRAAKPAVRMNVSKNAGVAKIELDHPDKATGEALLMDILATADADFLNGLIGQLANVGAHGREIDESGLNFMLSVIKGIEPRDQLEAMLAAQMAAVHTACMTFARRLHHVENIPQQDSAERTFNKLTRTFAAQLEALKRYRTGGEQKVTVQHVSVSEGGQAIVGNVTQAPRKHARDEPAASRPALSDANAAPMSIIDEAKEQVPFPARRGQNK
jgi:hypothetical protein